MQRDWIVRVPASSANLGPAFDAVAIALDRHLEVTDRGAPTPETHPAVRAFRQSGGEGPLSVRASFPGGRGLGYSGAARVAGLLAAVVQRGNDPRLARAQVLRDASELEGHADNAAASVYGGIVAVAAGHVVRIPLARVPAVVVWIPDRETPTVSARRLLPEHVPFDDAVFNVAHTALLVAALAAGDVGRAARRNRGSLAPGPAARARPRLARGDGRRVARGCVGRVALGFRTVGCRVRRRGDRRHRGTRAPHDRPRPRARDRRRGCDGFVKMHIAQPRGSSRTKAMKHGGTS